MAILEEAHALINGDRAETYGDGKKYLNHVAEQWALYIYQKHGITVQLTAEDICWMMADLKKIRQMAKGKRDNVIDAAGYLGLIEKVTELK